MGCLPYFKFFAGDWLSGTLGMTLEEKGAYIDLLAWSWEHGPLPSDAAGRARIVGLQTRRFNAIWGAVGIHWEKGGGGWVNPRIENLRAELAEKTEALSEAGKRGAERRWAAYREAQANSQANGVANSQAINQATGEANG